MSNSHIAVSFGYSVLATLLDAVSSFEPNVLEICALFFSKQNMEVQNIQGCLR